MKTVREAIGDYLALRRSLGFKLKKHQRFLEEFASFLEQESTSQITSRLALLWATQPKHIQPAEWAARLSVVRGFARYWSATDATTEVPPDGLLPYRPAAQNHISILKNRFVNYWKPLRTCQPLTACSRGRTTACSVFWPSQVYVSARHLIYGAQTSTGRKACSRSVMLSSENLDWFLSTFRA